jgi:hypothetical protein
MYNRLLLCCSLAMADVIFAVVSNQCPQGPAHLGNSSHLNVADEGFKVEIQGGVFEYSQTAKDVF